MEERTREESVFVNGEDLCPRQNNRGESYRPVMGMLARISCLKSIKVLNSTKPKQVKGTCRKLWG